MVKIVTPKRAVKPSVADAAVALVKTRGWYIYPSKEKNGAARVKWRTKSSNDPKQVRKWFTQWPNDVIYVDCERSGIGVIDADSKKGHGVDGISNLFNHELDHGELPKTLRARTPSGGEHYFFNDPQHKLKTTHGATNDQGETLALGAGIDTRGVGGAVVLAPTKTKGGRYSWLNDLPLADLPQWVIDLAGTPMKRADVPDAEFEPAYTEAEYVERLALIPVRQFDHNHDEWLAFMLACTHASTVEDGKQGFMDWTTDHGKGAYAGDYDLISARWDYNFFKRNMGGDAAKVGTFDFYLTKAGHGDKAFGTGRPTTPEEDFGADTPEAPKVSPGVARENIKRKIRALLKKTTKHGATQEEAKSALAKARKLMVQHVITADDLKDKKKKYERPPTTATFDDFYAYLPEHEYLFVPTRGLWPPATINSILGEGASYKLDRLKPVHQMAWCPGLDLIVKDRLVVKGGWIDSPGKNTFNNYLPAPELKGGDPKKADPWINLVRKIYASDADHLIKWMAHRLRHIDVKVNHGIISGSDKHGIGKDTAFEPLRRALGAWNVATVSATQAMDPKFNPFLESLVCFINEASDLGDDDRFEFYNRRKTWLASPPDIISVADKNVKLHPIANFTAIVISANEKSGLYLPAEDRRHFVAWSDCVPSDFAEDYWTKLYAWYDAGGIEHVVAYLRSIDLSDFDPKTPPPKTAAFWEIVAQGESTENSELADLIDELTCAGLYDRPVALTIEQLIAEASQNPAKFDEVHTWLTDRRSRRTIPHRLNKCGYVPIRNDDDATDGRWRVSGKRVMIYGRKDVPLKERIDAARAVVEEAFKLDAEARRKARLARKQKGNAPLDDIGSWP